MNDIKINNGMHINLFLEGKKCVIIGAGKVAFHKAELLLEAQAVVHVISLELSPEMERLLNLELITFQQKSFEENDIDSAFLVYAATNSRGANKQVLDVCRNKNILCCCVDGNWSSGDFTTPAISRHNQLMISISSGGTNCRQSKLIKTNLSRHIESLSAAHLIVVGTDHHHLGVEEREAFHLSGEKFDRAGFMIMQLVGIHEFMILNTCNRIEVIAVVAPEIIKNGILTHSLGFSSLKEDKYYLKTNEKAFEHLCLVTAGMLSQTPGENHITSQVKDSLDISKTKGWSGNMMQEWISSVLFVSKEIKNETKQKMQTEEIEELALRFIRSKDDYSKTIMIIGTGILGKSLVKASINNFKNIIWCYHRNKPEIKQEWQQYINLIGLNEIKNKLNSTNVIISAADSNGFILTTAHAPFFDLEKPTHIVDLGMPRTIDPGLQNLSADIQILDLDGIKYWNRPGLCHFYDFLTNSKKITEQNMNLYEKITNNFQSWN